MFFKKSIKIYPMRNNVPILDLMTVKKSTDSEQDEPASTDARNE